MLLFHHGSAATNLYGIGVDFRVWIRRNYLILPTVIDISVDFEVWIRRNCLILPAVIICFEKEREQKE